MDVDVDVEVTRSGYPLLPTNRALSTVMRVIGVLSYKIYSLARFVPKESGGGGRPVPALNIWGLCAGSG